MEKAIALVLCVRGRYWEACHNRVAADGLASNCKNDVLDDAILKERHSDASEGGQIQHCAQPAASKVAGGRAFQIFKLVRPRGKYAIDHSTF